MTERRKTVQRRRQAKLRDVRHVEHQTWACLEITYAVEKLQTVERLLRRDIAEQYRMPPRRIRK